MLLIAPQVVIDGHHRLELFRQAGMLIVPAVFVSNLPKSSESTRKSGQECRFGARGVNARFSWNMSSRLDDVRFDEIGGTSKGFRGSQRYEHPDILVNPPAEQKDITKEMVVAL
eukprot:6182894-Amphidinium_carterae.1